MLSELSQSHLEQPIRNGPRETGFEHLMLAVEETLHHRGQLMLYLRLMGATPPHLYDYR